jgi:hypothetical protein
MAERSGHVGGEYEADYSSEAMKTPCYVFQPGGVGDLMFISKITERFRDEGYEVIVPVPRRMDWMQEHLGRDRITYVDLEKPFPLRNHFFAMAEQMIRLPAGADVDGPLQTDQMLFLPFHGCFKFSGMEKHGYMVSKYQLMGIDHHDWVQHVQIKRNGARERRLLERLGIKEGDRFVLVNEQGSMRTIRIDVQAERVVRMAVTAGFTLFDWAAVVERASAILTIDTALVLLVEVLRPAVPLTVYSRYDPSEFGHIKPILRQPWRFALPIS